MCIELIEDAMGLKFSDSQKEIIMHNGSPANIISCAGSGKTTLLLASLAYNQLCNLINPRKTVVISFNKAAVDEIKARYDSLAKKLNLSTDITFKTFHALYYMILKYYYSKANLELNVLDEKASESLFSDAFYKYSSDKSDELKENMISLWGYCINNLIRKKSEIIHNPKYIVSGVDIDTFIAVVNEYSRLKKERNVLDFDDLQVKVLDLLTNHEEPRERIKKAFEYWYIDEYQDISKIQMNILMLSLKDHNKLVTIGDEDQSIYEFRGSKVDYIVDFPLYFNNSSRYIMDVNYRCPENILSRARNLIRNNNKRINKAMKSFKDGGEVVFNQYSDDIQMAISIADDVYSKFINGENLSEIAILYRLNRQPIFVVDQLFQKGIPFSISKNSTFLSNHIIVKDIINIINMALNDTDAELFKRHFLKTVSYVNKMFITVAYKRMLETGKSFLDCMEDVNVTVTVSKGNLKSIKSMIDKKATLAELIDVILPLYSNYMNYLVNKGKISKNDANNVIDYLQRFYGGMTYKDFLFNLERQKSVINLYSNRKNTVSLKTMHSVKGLEYDTVYLLGCDDEAIPNSKIVEKLEETFGVAEANDYVEQERRLFYVACTRAKEKLIITYTRGYATRFISELY